MSRKPHNLESLPVRERLLDSAERVVARDGVANFSLDAVAREASVSKGGLLYHFPSKSALITAIVERLGQRCEADQDRACETSGQEPGAFTRAYLTARVEPLDPDEQPVHTAILAAAGTNPHYLDPFRKRLAEWQHRIEADGIDPARASVVRLAIDGLCLMRLLGMPLPEGELLKRVIEDLKELTSPRGRELSPSSNGSAGQASS